MFRKITILVLCLFLISGCTVKKDESAVKEKDYYSSYIGYTPRDKNGGETDNEDFKTFEDEVFRKFCSLSYLETHFAVVDLNSYGIEKPVAEIPLYSYEIDEETIAFYDEILNELETFSFANLSLRQQYDYESLEFYCLEKILEEQFKQYDQLLSIKYNMPEDTITYLQDFTFYDEESVKDYIEILKSAPASMESIISYSECQRENGYPLSNGSLEYSLDFAERFLERKENNILISVFEEKIKEMDFLSQEQKEQYLEEEKAAILNYLIPAIEKIENYILDYGEGCDGYVLSDLNPEYARYSFAKDFSDSIDPLEALEILKENLAYQLSFVGVVYSDTDRLNSLTEILEKENDPIVNGSYRAMTDYLIENHDQLFPLLEDIEYSVSDLDPSFAPDTAKAYYWPAPVDNPKQNIIMVNPGSQADMDTFTTIAHESVPGHLYQHNYFLSSDPSPLRVMTSCIGYMEGWARYCMPFGIMLLGIDYETAMTIDYLYNYYFNVYSIIDIGIHFLGWKVEDIQNWLNSGATALNYNEQYAQAVYDILLNMPGVYERYAYGAAAFNVCLSEQIAEDDFDIIDYHKTLLAQGAVPVFEIRQLFE